MTLREELARIIRQWEEASSRNSLTTLAKETGLSYNTVRRAAQSEVEPHIQTVTKITQYLLEPREQLSFFEQYFPELAVVAQRWAGNNWVPLKSEISPVHFTQTDFHVFALVAGIQNGIRVQEIINETGPKGSGSIDRLVDGGAIQRDGDLLFPLAPDTMMIADKDALAAIRFIVDTFDIEQIHLRGSFYAHRFIGLSDAGVQKAHKIIWDAAAAIDAVKAEHPGLNVMAYGLLSTFVKNAKKAEG